MSIGCVCRSSAWTGGFAINKGVDLWFNVREDSQVNLSRRSFEGKVHFDLAKHSEVREMHWGDYARGAKYALKKRFELAHGIDGVLQGSLPVGGLSSSAAVLIAYVMAFAKQKYTKKVTIIDDGTSQTKLA